jgi:homocysteine S-methyltransferase
MTQVDPDTVRERLLEPGRITLFDGAMGTMLHARGVPLNHCYDELCVRQPALVADVHRMYVRAGADAIETNTYGANRTKLEAFGLGDRVYDLNAAATRIARQTVAETATPSGGRVLVAGTVGPLGLRIEPYGPTSMAEAKELFGEQISGLVDGGCDLLVLETFDDLRQLEQAIAAANESAPGVPVIAMMAVGDDLRTTYGAQPADIARALMSWGGDVIGLNCSVGPQRMLEAAELMVAVADRPVCAMPNAGLPQDVVGQRTYIANPEYVAGFARHLVHAGVTILGGCCGTTPEHTRAMAQALRAEQAMQRSASAQSGPAVSVAGGSVSVVESAAADADPHSVAPVELGDRSQVGRKLAAGAFIATIELVPPRGTDVSALVRVARELRDAGVDAINVPDGPRAQSRMSAIATSMVLQQQVGIEAITHYCCRDRNLLGMLSDLLGASALGLHNLLLITGDPPKMGPYPDATAVFDIDSIGLTNVVSSLNRGQDPGGNPLGTPTQFTVGVGLNAGALNMEEELRRYGWKVEAGADYAITQPVFDPAQLEDVLTRTQDWGIPVVAGIWPLVSARNAEFLANEVPGVSVPERTLERMRAASKVSKEHALAEGLAIAREMYERVRPLVHGVQVSAPFGRIDHALAVFDPADLGANAVTYAAAAAPAE